MTSVRPKLPLLRRLLKRLHPEGIPWPGAPLYNALVRVAIFQRHYDEVVRHVAALVPRGTILDIGTGPAWVPIKLQQLCPAARVIGLDVSIVMLAQARGNLIRRGLWGKVSLVGGNADLLPFADDSLDAILSTGSLHHWKRPEAALDEIHRVLRPGGFALLCDVVSDTPPAVLKETAQEHGRLKALFLWLHSFEEPFYSRRVLDALPTQSRFGGGKTIFLGPECCLMVRKTPNCRPVAAETPQALET